MREGEDNAGHRYGPGKNGGERDYDLSPDHYE